MKRIRFIISAIILSGLACNLTSTSSPTSTPSKEIGGGSAAVLNATQPLEVIDENGETITLEPPIPDAVELLNDMIEVGELSTTQGTIELLKVFVGENSPVDLFGTDQVSFESGWGLSMQAAGLLEELEDSPERDELLRLMNVLSPDPERLALYARPENEASNTNKTARVLGEQPQQVGVPCGSLWAEGFAGGASDPQVCLLFRVFTFKSREVRIFYPEVKRNDPAFMLYVNEAEAAIRDSLDRLSVYFDLPNINVIFTELEGPLAGILAQVPILERAVFERACPLIVYPLATTMPADIFKFAIAHETVHCVEGLQKGIVDYDATKWYSEGLAEYFANVVYKDVNYEHRTLPAFHHKSMKYSLLEMSYEAALFFQFLENRFGPEYLANLFTALPGQGDTSAQRAALANYDDMQTIFHEFGQAYFTSQILDTNKSAVPGPPAFYSLPDRRFEIERGLEITLSTEPFVLERAWLQLRSGTDYRITRTESGEAGRASWENQTQFEFVPIPETLKVLCEAPSIYFLLLTTGQDGNKTVLDLDFEAEADGLLNCCLVGSWEQTADQIRPNVEAALGEGLQLTSLEGRFILTFDENHWLQFFPEGYQGTVTLDSEDGERLSVAVAGLNVARYDTPEEGLIRVVGEDPNFSVTLGSPDGSTSIPLPAESLIGGPFAGSGRYRYTCTETTLTAETPDAAPFATSTFTRITELVPTPEPVPPADAPDPGPGDPGDLVPGDECLSLQVTNFSTSGSAAVWEIVNGTAAPAGIVAVSSDWPAGNGTWQEILLNDRSIWEGRELATPAIVENGWTSSVEARTLNPGVSGMLQLNYSGVNAAANGYILVVEFDNGCLLSDVR